MPTETKKPIRKKTPLQKHKDRECGCSMFKNEMNCVYQPFPDGWDFTTDVGNGKSRGEIFTPRFVIDKMLLEVGMFPEEGIYQLNYNANPKDALSYVQARVNEPAIGTANFTSTILWHKLEYAAIAARGRSKRVDRKKFDLYTLMAVSSIYANDIDPGNLTASILRLTRKGDIAAEEHQEHWTQILSEYAPDVPLDTIENQVVGSLAISAHNWNEKLQEDGVLYHQYKKHTGEKPGQWLADKWLMILKENIKLFNGISEETVITDTTVIPGWHTVKWAWWDFTMDTSTGEIEINRTLVPMMKQVYHSRLRTLGKKMRELADTRVLNEKGRLVHTDPKEKKAFSEVKRDIKKTLAILKENNPVESELSPESFERENEVDLFSLLDE